MNNSNIISYLRKYRGHAETDDIIIENVDKEEFHYYIKYKVSASANGFHTIYINNEKIYYDASEFINKNNLNRYIIELRKLKIESL